MNSNATSLQALLVEKGQPIPIANHYRILLHDPSHCFYVESGQLEIFFLKLSPSTRQDISSFFDRFAKQTIPFMGELIEGPLTFFQNVSSGHFVFSFPVDTESLFRVVAIANGSTHVYKMAYSQIEQLSLQWPHLKDHINRDWEHWLEATSSLFSMHSLTHYDYKAIPSAPLMMKKGEKISNESVDKKQEVIWIEVRQGALSLLGKPDLVITAPQLYPIHHEMWMQCEEDTTIEKRDPTLLILQPPYWNGIELFQSHFLKLFALFQHSQMEEEHQNARLTNVIEQRNLQNSLNELSTIFSSEEYLFQEEKHDVLYQTLQLIGKSLDLTFLPLDKKYDKFNFQEKLYYFCFNSHIFYREITLVKNWWKHDVGTLLGFYGDPAQPIALIRSASSYQMVDLHTQKTCQVDAHLDEALTPAAYTFYRALPSKAKIGGYDLCSFVISHRIGKVLLVLLFGSLSFLLMLFFPFANSLLFNLVIPNSDEPLLWQVTIGMLIISLTTTVFTFAREYLLVYLGGYFEHDLETGIWQRLFDLPLQFFRRFETGNLLIRAFAIRAISEKLKGVSLRLLLNVVFAAVYLLPMFYYSATMAWAGLSIIVIGWFSSFWFIAKNIQYNQAVFEYKGNTNGKLVQFFSGISKIRITGSENLMFILWEKLFFPVKKLEWKMEKLGNLVRVINFVISNFALLIIYAVAIRLLQSENSPLSQHLSVGNFIAFLAAFIPFSIAVADFCLTLLNISDIWPLWKFGRVILEDAPETNEKKSNPGFLNGDVRLDYVSFRYDKTSLFILDGISLDIKAGEFVGIVGHSGCGKSSIVKLLIGFETPEIGAVYYNGKDLNSLDIRHVRNQLGIVLQAGTILDGTIRDNIVTSGFYTDEEVQEALALSGFEEDLKRLPMGLNTVVMEGGASFSGGQRQRLLIARALISRPKILIMDEATSALDNYTQELVSRNLESLKVTRIVIAHRLNTVKKADRIYVLDKGKIVDQGTFKELASRKGVFSELAKKQNLSQRI